MKQFCNNLIENISQYFSSDEIKNIILSQKFFLYLLPNYYQCLKKELILEKFNFHIINLFGGITKFCQFKILSWKSEYIGFTDYIDSIPVEDLEHNKIMIGIDEYERPFITILDEYKTKVLFQRYSFYDFTWACSNFDDFYGHFFVNNEFQIQMEKITKFIL